MGYDAYGVENQPELGNLLRAGAALVLDPEARILAHRTVLPPPFPRDQSLIGRQAQEVPPQAFGALLRGLWERSLAHRAAVSAEFVQPKPRGEGTGFHCLSVRVAPFARDLSAVTLRDLTAEQVRAQHLLERIEHLNHQRDRWEDQARTLAHDVRSSLSALTGFVQLAINRGGLPGSEAGSYLDKAQAVAERLKSLTGRVLHDEASRNTAAEVLDLGFEGQRLFHALHAAHPRLLFTWSIEGDVLTDALPGEIFWNVFWNLLTNAVAYRHRERQLHIQYRCWRESPAVLVEVCDNGRGLRESEVDGIFLKGFRGSAAVGVEGTGLGLYGARTLLEEWGGEICAAPAPQGAAFRVRLPTGAAPDVAR